MAITETWLKANYNKARDKVEEFADRDAMSVRVSAKGKITFQLRFRMEGKAARIDIGTYPNVSLKDARDKSQELRAQIEKGLDPRLERKLQKHKSTAQNITLKELYDSWAEKYLFKNKKSAQEICRSFELHVFPKIGDLPADRISMQHWLDLLEPLAEQVPFVAERILSNGKQMMSWAVRRQACTNNPLVDINPKVDLHIEYVPKDRTLSDPELANIWRSLMRSRMFIRNRIFVQLCFVYGCRSGELRVAEKSHIDKDKMIWTIPAENHKTGLKSGKPLLRPLTKETLQLFELAATLNDSNYLFVSGKNKNQPLSRGALISLPYDLTEYLAREEDIKIDHWSLHDIRRTMRTNMSKLTEPHIAEIMIGHALPIMFRVYDHHDYIEEQREALQKWIARLQEIVAPYPVF
ncbi:tyrosine-type recombinase/integrase [Acinetobacter bereziniae]|uniref:tyrosine-type recombinase/integrase n=1 Tax=Acinetobacter bereziniae TaxID=106648 RepID=UPI00125F877F|nr:site-specific integrase [Acinetobacter bereziniae]